MMIPEKVVLSNEQSFQVRFCYATNFRSLEGETLWENIQGRVYEYPATKPVIMDLEGGSHYPDFLDCIGRLIVSKRVYEMLLDLKARGIRHAVKAEIGKIRNKKLREKPKEEYFLLSLEQRDLYDLSSFPQLYFDHPDQSIQDFPEILRNPPTVRIAYERVADLDLVFSKTVSNKFFVSREIMMEILKNKFTCCSFWFGEELYATGIGNHWIRKLDKHGQPLIEFDHRLENSKQYLLEQHEKKQQGEIDP